MPELVYVQQIQCCGMWTDYPTADTDTQCPCCRTVFTIGGDDDA